MCVPFATIMTYLKNLKLFKVYVSSKLVHSNNTDLFLIL